MLLSALLPLGGRAQTWQWATGPYAVTGSTYTRASINSMVTDGAGNTYVAGSFAYKFDVGSLTPISSVGTTDDLDAFVAKLDNAGTWLWVAHIGGIRDEWISDIALDGNGNLAVVGNYCCVKSVLSTNLLVKTLELAAGILRGEPGRGEYCREGLGGLDGVGRHSGAERRFVVAGILRRQRRAGALHHGWRQVVA